jgi:hypothetical protein
MYVFCLLKSNHKRNLVHTNEKKRTIDKGIHSPILRISSATRRNRRFSNHSPLRRNQLLLLLLLTLPLQLRLDLHTTAASLLLLSLTWQLLLLLVHDTTTTTAVRVLITDELLSLLHRLGVEHLHWIRRLLLLPGGNHSNRSWCRHLRLVIRRPLRRQMSH